MKLIRVIYFFVVVMTVLSLTSAAFAGKYALVIGNGSYKDEPLSTPVNDADAMASTLRSLGFSVSKETDINHRTMEQAIRDFGSRLSPGDTALFYFSGHGAQSDGSNYLIPIGADIQSEDEIKHKSVPADMVLAKMKSARSAVNIIILDACRNNPFKGFKSLGEGLAPMAAAKGTFIAYATAPGTKAYTGNESASIYTKHLINLMKKPGLKIEDVFKRVRESVVSETSDKQVPWETSSLMGDFYFMMEESKPSPVEEYFNIVNVAIWDFLYIHEQPNPNSPNVGKIPYDGKCIKYLNNYKYYGKKLWKKIQYDSVVGWINSEYVIRGDGCR